MISRSRFRHGAKEIPVTIGKEPMKAIPKEFKPGSLGWYAGGKVIIEIDGEPVRCQVGLNITVIGSKHSPP